MCGNCVSRAILIPDMWVFSVQLKIKTILFSEHAKKIVCLALGKQRYRHPWNLMDRFSGSISKPQFLIKKKSHKVREITSEEWHWGSPLTSIYLNTHTRYTHLHTIHTPLLLHTHIPILDTLTMSNSITHTYTCFCYTYLYSITPLRNDDLMKWYALISVTASIPSSLFHDILVYIFIICSLRNFRIGPV